MGWGGERGHPHGSQLSPPRGMAGCVRFPMSTGHLEREELELPCKQPSPCSHQEGCFLCKWFYQKRLGLGLRQRVEEN